MSWLTLVVVVSIVVIVAISVWVLVANLRRPDPLEELGVRTSYPFKCLPTAKIDSYYELKEKMREQYAKDLNGGGNGCGDPDVWMSKLPLQAKDALKYRLMQRAIGDMAALQKVDTDARGYWRLFSKGVVTKQFWNSVVEVEKELSEELESVKTEASRVEPMQDPQGIISEAMQFVIRYGDKLPSAADIAGSADAMAELMKHLPPPGHPALEQLAGAAAAAAKAGFPGGPGGPPGGPGGMPPMPGGMPPLPPGYPGYPGGPGGAPPGMRSGHPPPGVGPYGEPAPQNGGTGAGEAYKWKQDTDEIEVSVKVPTTAVKSEVKITIQSRCLKVQHRGEFLVEGQLAGVCRPEGSTWTMSKGLLVVTLEKAGPRPWKTLLVGEEATTKPSTENELM